MIQEEKRAAILYAIEQIAYQNGDLYLNLEQLENYAYQALGETMDLNDAIFGLIEEKKIVFEENRYYLALTYYAEKGLADKIRILVNQDSMNIDEGYLETLLTATEIQKNMTYTSVQKEAIITALTHRFTIITGGPGTGKTTIIDGLLDVYRKYFKLNFKKPCYL